MFRFKVFEGFLGGWVFGVGVFCLRVFRVRVLWLRAFGIGVLGFRSFAFRGLELRGFRVLSRVFGLGRLGLLPAEPHVHRKNRKFVRSGLGI